MSARSGYAQAKSNLIGYSIICDDCCIGRRRACEYLSELVSEIPDLAIVLRSKSNLRGYSWLVGFTSDLPSDDALSP